MILFKKITFLKLIFKPHRTKLVICLSFDNLKLVLLNWKSFARMKYQMVTQMVVFVFLFYLHSSKSAI